MIIIGLRSTSVVITTGTCRNCMMMYWQYIANDSMLQYNWLAWTLHHESHGEMTISTNMLTYICWLNYDFFSCKATGWMSMMWWSRSYMTINGDCTPTICNYLQLIDWIPRYPQTLRISWWGTPTSNRLVIVDKPKPRGVGIHTYIYCIYIYMITYAYIYKYMMPFYTQITCFLLLHIHRYISSIYVYIFTHV